MKIKTDKLIYIYLILWFLINIFFLTEYPFVHSDETWLSGLSRSMIENNTLASTEDFFDLYERNPHAIKILYHKIQIIFIKIFGYSIFSIRLISIITGCISLLLLYKLVLKFILTEHRKIIALITVILCSIDVQFIYISHLGRQEIILIFSLLLMLNITNSNIKYINRGIITGIVLGLSVGIHPNSFIIAWPIGLFIFWEAINKRKKWTELFSFILTTSVFASIFIVLSFKFNLNFINDYMSYGEPLGVLDTTDVKLIKLPGFYKKLFLQISGTYHNPNIRLQMVLFPVLLIISLIKKKSMINILGFLGFNIGLIIIGKYSQPSISFLLPFFYLSTTVLTEEIIFRKNVILQVILYSLVVLSLTITIKDIKREKESFKNYQNNLKIPNNSIVLSSIINEYTFQNGQIFDWRNLHFLKENNLTLENYIKQRKIEYIIIPEELSYIYNNRPYWNVLYGNLSNWYPMLTEFTEENCSLINEFESPGYGIRITALRYKRPWYIKIYKVNQIESIIE